MTHASRHVLIIEENTAPDAGHYLLRIDGVTRDCEYVVDPDGLFEKEVDWYLDEYPTAPLLEGAHAGYVRQAIIARGVNLWRGLARPEAPGEGGPESAFREVRVLGSGRIFSPPWEIMRRREDEDPAAVTIPVVRVLRGAKAYPVPARRPGLLRVLSVSARMGPKRDNIPPRRISLRLARKKWLQERVNFQLVEPGELWHLKQTLGLELETSGSGAFDVLHVDAHGELFEYATLYGAYGRARRFAEEMGLLTPVVPYGGRRGFVILEFEDTGLPVTGEELGALARAHAVRAVVLNACRAGSRAAAGSVAVELARAGVPDVVAFGHRLTLRGAELLVDGFYDALATDLSVPKAVTAARRAMYADKRRGGAGGVRVEIDDWASLIHYQVEDAETLSGRPELPRATAEEVIDERPPADALAELPRRWEWYVRLLYKSLETAGQPMIVYGIRGSGPEYILEEFLRWTTLGTRRFPMPVLASAAGGLDQFIQELAAGVGFDLSPEITGTTEDVIAEQIGKRLQEPTLFAFPGVDKGVDGGALTIPEVAFIYRLAKTLRAAGNAVILTDTWEPSAGTQARPLAEIGRCDVVVVSPLYWRDMADWDYFDVAPAEDDTDALSRLLVGVLGGGVPPLVWAQQCSDAGALEAVLDVVVLHAGHEQPDAWDRLPEICRHDLNESCQAITARLAAADHSHLITPEKLAAVGASATWTHLGMLEMDTPREKPKAAADLKDELMTLIEVSRLGLARQAVGSDQYRHRRGVFQFDPHLRHCLRRRMTVDDASRWDCAHHSLYTTLLGSYHLRNEEIGGREAALDLISFDLPNILIALWRALRGFAPLSDVIDGYVSAVRARVWPGRLDLSPWLVRRLCSMGESAEITGERRADMAKSLALLVRVVRAPFADEAREGLRRIISLLETDHRDEAAGWVDAILNERARQHSGLSEAELARIETLAKTDVSGAFIAAIELGEALRYAGDRDPSEAVAAYRKALELGGRLGSPYAEAIAHYHLGVIESRLHQAESAEKSFWAALSLAVTHGPEMVVAESHYELGIIFESRGLPDRAKGFYRQAIIKGQEVGCASAVIHSYQNLANIELNYGAPEVASYLVDQADRVLRGAILTDRVRAEEEVRNRRLRLRVGPEGRNLDETGEFIPERFAEPEKKEAAPTLKKVLDILRGNSPG